jgi:hypothetical protein
MQTRQQLPCNRRVGAAFVSGRRTSVPVCVAAPEAPTVTVVAPVVAAVEAAPASAVRPVQPVQHLESSKRALASLKEQAVNRKLLLP